MLGGLTLYDPTPAIYRSFGHRNFWFFLIQIHYLLDSLTIKYIITILEAAIFYKIYKNFLKNIKL
jgi:hypothetical protein